MHIMLKFLFCYFHYTTLDIFAHAHYAWNADVSKVFDFELVSFRVVVFLFLSFFHFICYNISMVHKLCSCIYLSYTTHGSLAKWKRNGNYQTLVKSWSEILVMYKLLVFHYNRKVNTWFYVYCAQKKKKEKKFKYQMHR